MSEQASATVGATGCYTSGITSSKIAAGSAETVLFWKACGRTVEEAKSGLFAEALERNVDMTTTLV